MALNHQLFDSICGGDRTSVEEIVKNAKNAHGQAVKVTVAPESMLPHDLIYHALFQMVANKQLGYLFNDKEHYQAKIKELREEQVYKFKEILDDVIMGIEEKVGG